MDNKFLDRIHFNYVKKQLADDKIKKIIECQLNEIINYIESHVDDEQNIISVIYREKENILNIFNNKYISENILVHNEEKSNPNDYILKVKKLIKCRIDREIEMQIGEEEDKQIVAYIIERKLIIDALLNNNAKFIPMQTIEKESKSLDIK